jgi:hypothetical protein
MSAREQFDDAQLERLQNRIRAIEDKLSKYPFLNGSAIDVDLDITSTRVLHRLGRAPRGVIVVSASPDAALGLSATQPDDPANAVNLEASDTASFKLWFW